MLTLTIYVSLNFSHRLFAIRMPNYVFGKKTQNILHIVIFKKKDTTFSVIFLPFGVIKIFFFFLSEKKQAKKKGDQAI